MARKALLTVSQCAQIRALYKDGARAIELAKKFNVSESSLYKVLDKSYQARPDDPARPVLPVIPDDKPAGLTPSLFAHDRRAGDRRAPKQHLDPALAKVLAKAQVIDNTELDELTLAAAELVVAKAHFNRVLAHVH